MQRLRAGCAALVYCASFAALGILSSKLLASHGSCSDVYFAFDRIGARTSAGTGMPVPVVQMCGGHTLAALLIALTILASLAWAALLRWTPRRSILAACALIALGTAFAFAYLPTTDPYAYALYGYEAAHGQTPYAAVSAATAPGSRALATLYRFFPPGSTDRVANYGPAAVLEYHAVALAAGDSLRRFVLVLRAFHALLLLLLAWLLAQIRAPGLMRSQAAWVVFHPLLVLESVAFGHGDVLMLVLLGAAFLAYRKNAFAASAVLIVAASEVRMAAGLALVVLFLETNRRYGTLAFARTAAASLAAFAGTAAAARAAYGHFTLGGAPSLEAYASPMMLAFNAATVTAAHVRYGMAAQALCGFAIVVLAVRFRRYALAGLGTLAALPIIRAWYCQWAVPLVAVDADPRVRAASFAAASIAIIAEWPAMTGHSGVAAWSVILSLQWLLPAAAAGLARLRPARALPAQIAASPST